MAGTLLKMGFLGAGQMASALALGWLRAGLISPASAVAADPFPQARERFGQLTGIPVTANNGEVVAASDILLIAVKPQHVRALLAEIAPHLKPSHTLVSIAAGITLAAIAEAVGADRAVVRVMPNTPALVGESASGYACGPKVSSDTAAVVDTLLNAVGKAFAVPEHLLDAVTGLSGSGPAYVCLMIEALSDGGVRMGLPRDVATALAAQTLLGTAKMVLETGKHPGQLKDAVASPGGTTIAGIHALERGGLRAALMDAVEAAARRATELGNG